MRTITGKTKNGGIYKGIYTNNRLPNQKPKRVRQPQIEENDTQTFKFSCNLFGLFSSAIVYLYAPLPLLWRFIIVAMLLLSSCHMEVEE